MRVTLEPEALASPHPIASLMPGLFQDDDLVLRFTAALDTVMAPVVAVLDSADAYVDPMLAPIDFVTWLAQWVGVELDAAWPEHRQRALVARAAELYAWRGTVRGLSALITITTGVVPEIEETGGVSWTSAPPPSGDLPGYRTAALVVRVRVPAGAEPVDSVKLDRLVSTAKPAHVPHRVEVLQAAPRGNARKSAPARARPDGARTRTPSAGPAGSGGSSRSGSGSGSGSSTPRAQRPPATPPSPAPDDGGLDEPWGDGAGGTGPRGGG